MSGRRSIVTLCVLLAAFAASMLARRQAERHSAKVFVQGVQLDFPVAYARILALEHDGALAALLWIRFVQQIPLKPADEQTGRSLARQLHGVVALDPAFRSAYVQGTVLLSVLGNQPCAAVEIAEKGIERFPQDWRIPFEPTGGHACKLVISH